MIYKKKKTEKIGNSEFIDGNDFEFCMEYAYICIYVIMLCICTLFSTMEAYSARFT